MKTWPSIYSEPCGSGVIKQEFADFRVVEQLSFEPSGNGEHLFVFIEKVDANTRFVANELARLFGCASKDIGFAGMKDRHAITQQWFSVYLTKAKVKDWQQITHPNFSIVKAAFHNKKLKIGELESNRFTIVVRNFLGNMNCVEYRIQELAQAGLPNYFGPQRFGNDFSNWHEGKAWLKGALKASRNQEGLLISALRSYLFNEILAERVKQGNWNKLIDGDVAYNTEDGKVLERYSSPESLIPAAPLFGRDRYQSKEAAAAIQEHVLQRYGEITDQLLKKRVNGDWRPLVCRVSNLNFNRLSGNSFTLEFTLPKGSFATNLINQIIDTH